MYLVRVMCVRTRYLVPGILVKMSQLLPLKTPYIRINLRFKEVFFFSSRDKMHSVRRCQDSKQQTTARHIGSRSSLVERYTRALHSGREENQRTLLLESASLLLLLVIYPSVIWFVYSTRVERPIDYPAQGNPSITWYHGTWYLLLIVFCFVLFALIPFIIQFLLTSSSLSPSNS